MYMCALHKSVRSRESRCVLGMCVRARSLARCGPVLLPFAASHMLDHNVVSHDVKLDHSENLPRLHLDAIIPHGLQVAAHLLALARLQVHLQVVRVLRPRVAACDHGTGSIHGYAVSSGE